MRWLFALQTAWQVARGSLLANRMRSVLTMLGIVIGIASVILMLSLGRGAQALVLGQVSDFGADTVFIESGRGDEHGPPQGIVQNLKERDIEKLRQLSSLDLVSAVVFFADRLVYADSDEKVQVVGTLPEQQTLDNVYPIAGRFFDESEHRSRVEVAVLGHKVALDVFGSAEAALGQRIKLKQQGFRVIGVLEEQGTKFFTNFDTNVYIPLGTAFDLFGVDYLSYITARSVVPADLAKEDIRLALRESHDLDNPSGDLGKDDFVVSTPVDAAEIIGTVGLVLTLLLTSIAAVSLVVGGIGIMNIMLVTVTERTREIGLRLAVGARRRDILQQFLLESTILTLLGGLIGTSLGIGLSFIGAKVLGSFVSGWRFVVPPDAILLAVGVSLGVGLVFGIYPARRAAGLNPITALHYE